VKLLKKLCFTVKSNISDLEILLQKAAEKEEELKAVLDEISAFKFQVELHDQEDSPDGQETG
jgi:hypothetical protein